MFIPTNKHPHKDEYGRPIIIHRPHKAGTSIDNITTFTPKGIGIQDSSVEHHQFEEPPIEKDKRISAGVICQHHDGRIWVCSPTNQFGGYTNTFPKGGHCEGSLIETAARETHEETGITPKITGLLGDYNRSTSVSRYYIGQTHSGHPEHMGWESQAVHLVPKEKLVDFMDQPIDKHIARDYLNHIK